MKDDKRRVNVNDAIARFTVYRPNSYYVHKLGYLVSQCQVGLFVLFSLAYVLESLSL